MTVTPEDLKKRTMRFALRVIRLVESLPHGRAADVIGRQLLRSSTSVGANYRAACHARSQADFVAKMGVVQEEVDESLYWMELLVEAKAMPSEKLSSLLTEAKELLAIAISSINTARGAKRPRHDRSPGVANSQSTIHNPQSGNG